MTADATPFLNAIRAAPDDDAPRLVYADWLDEHGNSPRAEFIRVQCELARRESADLRAREAELLARHHDDFAGRVAAPHLRFRFRRGFAVGFGHTGLFVRDRVGSRSGSLSYFQFRMDGTWSAAVGMTAESFVYWIRQSPSPADDADRGPYILDPLEDPAVIRFERPVYNPSARTGTFDGRTFVMDVHDPDTDEHRLKRFVHTPIDGFDSFDDPLPDAAPPA